MKKPLILCSFSFQSEITDRNCISHPKINWFICLSRPLTMSKSIKSAMNFSLREQLPSMKVHIPKNWIFTHLKLDQTGMQGWFNQTLSSYVRGHEQIFFRVNGRRRVNNSIIDGPITMQWYFEFCQLHKPKYVYFVYPLKLEKKTKD